MKNILKISTFILILLASFSFQAEAQDALYGYVNSQELILLLPEAETADKQLESYQKTLDAEFQKKVATWESDVAAFQSKAEDMAPKQQQEVGAGLQKRQQDLVKEEQQLGVKLNQKRNELLEPIVIKIDEAIKAVGKKGGYTMIFDSSGLNVMLYLDEALDVMPLVRAQLKL